MGDALTQERSAHLRDLLIAEGRIGDALGSLDDFIEDLEGEVGIETPTPRPQRQMPDDTAESDFAHCAPDKRELETPHSQETGVSRQ